MKRHLAMTRKANGGTTPAAPSYWDETKNIYIQYRWLRRLDHLLLPRWNDFQEYCENNTFTTQQQYDDASINLNATTDPAKIGITELTFAPFADETNPATWAYNSDFNNSNSRWTDGNEIKVVNFYYITRRDNTQGATQLNAPHLFRLYALRNAIESQGFYNYGAQDVAVSNQNLNTYYGTLKKGTGGSIVDLFKVGDTETLKNVQTAASYAGGRYLTYDYASKLRTGTNPSAPFANGRQLTNQAYIYSEPGVSLAANNKTIDAAILGYFNNEVITTIGNYTYRFTSILVAVDKDRVITERSIL